MSEDPSRIGSRLFSTCIGVLLASMALYGAVLIVQAIWVWLCIGLAALGAVAAIWWLLAREYRGW